MSEARSPLPRRPGPLEVAVMGGIALTLLLLSWTGAWSVSLTESWGFATGGICVWLVVRENIWNWPVGLVNNIVFFLLFHQSRLFADMWLQAVYFALGLYGWRQWLRGGSGCTTLRISRTGKGEWLALLLLIPLLTWLFRLALLSAGGAAPFWDSLTTVLSLAAQYLLCRKRLENWLIWILADLIYVPLYFSRGLPLTAVLYGVFLILCLLGWKSWRGTWRQEGGAR